MTVNPALQGEGSQTLYRREFSDLSCLLPFANATFEYVGSNVNFIRSYSKSEKPSRLLDADPFPTLFFSPLASGKTL